MEKPLNRFFINLLVFTIIIATSGLVLQFVKPQMITTFWPLLQIMFFAITFGLIYTMPSGKEKKFSRFANFFMVTSMVKILMFLIIIIVYAFAFPADAVRFAITLMVFYFLYLGFEVYWMLKLSRKGN